MEGIKKKKLKTCYKWFWWQDIWLKLTLLSYPHFTLSPFHSPPPIPFPAFFLTLVFPDLFLPAFSLFSLFLLLAYVFFFFCSFTPLYLVSPSLFSSSCPLLSPSLPSLPSLPLCSWDSGHYQGVFTSILALLYPPHLPPSLSPLSSHFHAARRAAMLCVFISVCGRGGGLVPATNGLLENTDSHASQARELGREARRIWSEAEGRMVSERDGGRHTRDSVC